MLLLPDKQQEIDVPALKVEDADAKQNDDSAVVVAGTRQPPMSQISGVRRLRHMNSFTGIVPKFGVPAVDDESLKEVSLKNTTLCYRTMLRWF